MTVHSHWNLLRPCRVVLPVSLDAGEIEFWQRLLDQERVTLEKYRGTTDFERTIEIDCAGPVLEEEILPPPTDRWATAFSGGKDSLVQAALLCELTERPLLVNVSSPMPPLIDNDWPYRDRTMDEIARRRDVELVVVNSDLRSIWPHYEIPHKLGYPLSMGLIGDTYFYVAMMMLVAASRGVRRLSLATEIEHDQSEDYHGRTAFHETSLGYALPLLMIIDRLLKRDGMEFGSLLIPFNHYQIEKLLRKRYPDLADLQISCFWMQKPTERSCSRCSKCIRIALLMISMDEDPATLDIDLTRMFTPPYDYDPIKTMLGGRTMAYAAAMIDKTASRRFFPQGNLIERVFKREPQAFREFKQVVERFSPYTKPEVEMTHLEYFRYIPKALRERIKDISLQYWPVCDQMTYTPDPSRIDPIVGWITETL